MQFPIRHNNHILEQKSDTFLRQHLPQEWNVTKPNNDYGQDLNIEICEEGQYKGLDLIVQLKSSMKSDTLNSSERQQLKVSTYNYLKGNLRVAIIIKFVEEENEAYWILLKDIPDPKSELQESFTVNIPKVNRISNLDWNVITDYVRSVTDDKLKVTRLVETLERAKNELKQAKEEVNAYKDTISQLTSKVSIQFSGQWTSEPFPSQLISPINDQWFLTFQSKEDFSEIKFYATETYTFKSLNSTQAEFNCRLAIKPGETPLGENIDFLKNYQIVNLFLPFILYEKIENNIVTINQLNVEIVFNGMRKERIELNQEFDVEVKVYNNDKSCGWAIFTIGRNKENENVLDYLKKA